MSSEPVYPDPVITGAQIRAARAMLGWSLHRLSEAAGVSHETIRRAEAANNEVPPLRAANLSAIQRALELGGIAFFDAGELRQGGAGLRIK